MTDKSSTEPIVEVKEGTVTEGETVREPAESLEPVEGGEELRNAAAQIASAFTVEDYRAPGTEYAHGHDRTKHDVRSKFNVSEELVERFFWFDPADHAAPHELLARKEEFINSDVEVFTDTNDDDPSRWESIKSTANSARIPDHAHRTLDKLEAQEL